MIFEENDLLLSRRSGSSFVEQIIRPNTGSLVTFDNNLLPIVVPSSSIRVVSSSYALTASYALNSVAPLPISALTSGSIVTVRNGEKNTILKGQVVKIFKAPSTHSLNTDKVVVRLADALEHVIGSEVYGDILGVAAENINTGTEGDVLTKGYLGGIDTSTGFTDGDIIYVSPTTSGSFTKVKPVPPIESIQVGHITKIGSSDGVIFVDIKQPLTLDFVSNVSSSSSPRDNSLFVYDGARNVWYDKADGLVLSGSLSGSDVSAGSLTAGTVVVQDSLTALNITSTNNIVSENDITATRDIWVGRQLIASGSTAPFRVVSAVDNSNVLYVTGSRVGIGNKMDPAFTLEVNGSFAATTKSFVIDHQEQPGKRLVHATLEGPEHAVFIRGRSNSLELEMPEYWKWLIDENSITVHLTAIGNANVYFVKKIENNKIYIDFDKKQSLWSKLFKDSDINFYYLVNAERKDVDRLQTVI